MAVVECTAHDEECDPCRARWYLFLGLAMETAAALTLVRSMGYHEGFENGRVIKEFCADNQPAV